MLEQSCRAMLHIVDHTQHVHSAYPHTMTSLPAHLLIRPLAAKLLLRPDSSAKKWGRFCPTRSVWARVNLAS